MKPMSSRAEASPVPTVTRTRSRYLRLLALEARETQEELRDQEDRDALELRAQLVPLAGRAMEVQP